MSDFKANMHKIRFRLGLGPDPAGGYSAPPDPVAGLEGSTSKGRGGEGRGGECREREVRGRTGKG